MSGGQGLQRNAPESMFPPYPIIPHGLWRRALRAAADADAPVADPNSGEARRRVVIFVAASLDGHLACRDGSIDWLPQSKPGGEDYGYGAFMKTVDTLLMGRKTYEQLLSYGGWPYAGKRGIVFSSTRRSGGADGVEFVDCDIAAYVRDLKASPGSGTIWLVGGAEIIAACLGGEVVDELVMSIVPVLLGEGLRLFPERSWTTGLRHLRTRVFPDGLVQHVYALRPTVHRTSAGPLRVDYGRDSGGTGGAPVMNRAIQGEEAAVGVSLGICAWRLGEGS